MKSPLVGYFPCALAAIGFVAFGFVLKLEMDTSRRLAEAWAERDLSARTELAAASIGDALATGDFNRLREFADMRRLNDLRLTVLSAPGGMVYDSEPTASGNHAGCPEVRAALHEAGVPDDHRVWVIAALGYPTAPAAEKEKVAKIHFCE